MKLKILGPPGTGKTTRLMELLEEEIKKGTPPNRIAFLTFTRAARVEALQRTGKTEDEFPYLRTIHAICYRQLNISQDQIVKPASLRVFGKYLGVKLNGNNTDPWVEEFDRNFEAPTRDDMLLAANHCGRHRGLLLKDALQFSSFEIDYKYAVWFTKAYRAWKSTEGILDYTDLLTDYIEVGKSLDIDTIFVDEAQDLSSLQWEVVQKLGAQAKTWYIAGDDDQAIFHWAGADSSVFQDLIVDDTQVLGQSFRVSKSVHRTAMFIANRIQKRLEKEYSPTNMVGEVANIGYLRNHKFDDKTFVLFRNHYRGQELAKQLKEDGIPFIGHGSPLVDPDVRAALVGWHRIIKKGEVSIPMAKKLIRFADDNYTRTDLKRKFREPDRTTVTMSELFYNPPVWTDWSTVLSKLPGKDILDNCIRRVGFLGTAKPTTELLSIHQSKGRECDTVVLDTEMSRAVYDGMMRSPDDEHRVWYVAVTRAKSNLFFLMPDNPYSYHA